MDMASVKESNGSRDLEQVLGGKTFTTSPEAHLISTALALSGERSDHSSQVRAGRCSDGKVGGGKLRMDLNPLGV